MSAVDDLETSVNDNQPIELYEFLGTYKNYFYTSDGLPVLFNGRVFEPLRRLSRSPVKAGTDTEESASCRVTIPVRSDLIADYGFQTTPPKLGLNILRVYRNLLPYETNYRTIWTGPVTNISIKGNSAILDIPSLFSSLLGSSCPSVNFQTPCNHVLYDPDTCRVPRVPNSVDTTVASILSGGMVIRLLSYGAFPPSDYVSGEILIPSQSERRMVIGADDGTGELTVNYPFGRIVQGTAVQVARGCDHAWKGHCLTRYGNTKRFGGHPVIPPVNVFESGL